MSGNSQNKPPSLEKVSAGSSLPSSSFPSATIHLSFSPLRFNMEESEGGRDGMNTSTSQLYASKTSANSVRQSSMNQGTPPSTNASPGNGSIHHRTIINAQPVRATSPATQRSSAAPPPSTPARSHPSTANMNTTSSPGPPRQPPSLLQRNSSTSSSNVNDGRAYQPSEIGKAALLAAHNGLPTRDRKGSLGKRFSVQALYSMATELDSEVNDDLNQAQNSLRELKGKISVQSKKNFLLERDVRYLDGRIGLLIHNRMAMSEANDIGKEMDTIDTEAQEVMMDDRKKMAYGNLFCLLQNEPHHIGTLARLVTLSEIDTLLQTVMFTLFGNQYDSREEYLLLSMFQTVLASQFETANDFGSLMRANSPVSRMMTTYTRRGPGQAYLKSILSAPITSLIKNFDEDLEINPTKVYDQMINDIELKTGAPSTLPKTITLEEAQKHPDVVALINPRIKKILNIAEMFFKSILDSIDRVPFGIRWICKQIKSLTMRKFPESTDDDVASLIGGFFMLRYVNPAIVTPNAYMLIDITPGKNSKRTLTLLAKLLQNLANKPTLTKESYMVSLNTFVEKYRNTMNKFFFDLCDVSDFYESLEMEQYMALSKKDITLNVTLNELYNTHELLVKHRDEMKSGSADHLRLILDELGNPPPQAPKTDNKTICLPLVSRFERRVKTGLNKKAANELTQNDILYMDTKGVFVHILRCMPHLSVKPLNLRKIADSAAQSAKDPSLVNKGIQLMDMLTDLENLGIIDPKDNYHLLSGEILTEIENLGSIRESVNKEITSLYEVYRTILDHNAYLKSQLETYKAYLQNVRLQSVGSQQRQDSMKTFKFTHAQFEKEGVIEESGIPMNRRVNIFFKLSSPAPGSFVISLHYKGRDNAVLEMNLQLDDLLERQQMGVEMLDLEYVKLHVPRFLGLVNRHFLSKK